MATWLLTVIFLSFILPEIPDSLFGAVTRGLFALLWFCIAQLLRVLKQRSRYE